jgi:hypothetical protein
MKKPQAISVDIIQSEKPVVWIRFYYEKTYREIGFLADRVEEIPDKFGKRYILQKVDSLIQKN